VFQAGKLSGAQEVRGDRAMDLPGLVISSSQIGNLVVQPMRNSICVLLHDCDARSRFTEFEVASDWSQAAEPGRSNSQRSRLPCLRRRRFCQCTMDAASGSKTDSLHHGKPLLGGSTGTPGPSRRVQGDVGGTRTASAAPSVFHSASITRRPLRAELCLAIIERYQIRSAPALLAIR
jgi:hypothetical protein